jgi:hypothetical protein
VGGRTRVGRLRATGRVYAWQAPPPLCPATGQGIFVLFQSRRWLGVVVHAARAQGTVGVVVARWWWWWWWMSPLNAPTILASWNGYVESGLVCVRETLKPTPTHTLPSPVSSPQPSRSHRLPYRRRVVLQRALSFPIFSHFVPVTPFGSITLLRLYSLLLSKINFDPRSFDRTFFRILLPIAFQSRTFLFPARHSEAFSPTLISIYHCLIRIVPLHLGRVSTTTFASANYYTHSLLIRSV